MDLIASFDQVGNRASERAAKFVIKHPDRVTDLLDLMGSRNKRIKNAAAKAVRIISGENPKLLVSYHRRFCELIHSGDSIVKWISIDVIGNLTYIDDRGRVNAGVLRHLFGLLRDESIVTAAHAIETLGKIAENKNRYRKVITEELHRIQRMRRNPECRDILLGKAIDSFNRYWEQSTRPVQEKISELVIRQLKNQRPGTRKRATNFAKKHAIC